MIVKIAVFITILFFAQLVPEVMVYDESKNNVPRFFVVLLGLTFILMITMWVAASFWLLFLR